MRFIQKWSYSCANHLSAAMNETHQRRSVYYYGFQVLIGAVVKAVLLVSVSLLLGILLPALLITLAFASLRTIAGGYHMDTYGKCILVSMGLFVGAGLISQYTYTYWSFGHLAVLIAVTFISGLYVIIRYAPRDTPNKPITDPKEIRKFKLLSIIYIFIWLIVVGILTAFKLNVYVISLCFGILLELFAISPTGHKFFDVIKDGFNAKKAEQH